MKECFIKLYAKKDPSADETVVGTATCAAEGLEPDPVWVGDGLDFSHADKGITKLEVNWKAEYATRDQLSMPRRPTSPFFISNAPVPIGIIAGHFRIYLDGM